MSLGTSTKVVKLSFYVAFKMSSISSFLRRTLSNWVYELDKWAPSVVKIAYKVQTNTHKTLFCCVPFLPLSFLARRFGRLSRCKNTFPFVPLQGNSRLAPRICATTAQREVQCVADHLWIHHQGQADTCQGKRHENLILSLERIGGPLLPESSVAWPWSLKVTHKGRNTGFGV